MKIVEAYLNEETTLLNPKNLVKRSIPLTLVGDGTVTVIGIIINHPGIQNPPYCSDCTIPMKKMEETNSSINFLCPNCSSKKLVPKECIIETS